MALLQSDGISGVTVCRASSGGSRADYVVVRADPGQKRSDAEEQKQIRIIDEEEFDKLRDRVER